SLAVYTTLLHQLAIQEAHRDDVIVALGGDDSVDGGGGNDTICLGDGNDKANGGDGNDRILGEAGTDRIVASLGDDAVFGGAGDDRLDLGQGNDAGNGQDGNDTVLGGAGNDRLIGGQGIDTVSGDAGRDNIFGGAGRDSLDGGAGIDTIAGQDGADTIDGAEAGDKITGGPGEDTINGGPGADRIRSGPDRDQAFGRGGSDVFVIGAACEAKSGETVDGGPGFDRVQSPLTRAQLEARGVSFVSIESFEIIPPLFDECADVKKAWGDAPVVAPGGEVFVDAAPRPGGGFLAATGGKVFSVSPAGAVAPLGSGDRAFLNPGGDTFGILQGNTFRVFDASGALLGSLPLEGAFSYFKLIPGGDLVFAPRVTTLGHEKGRVDRLRILRPDASVVADVPAPGLEISRLFADRIVYTLPSALIARRLDGTVLWNAPVDVHKLESAADRTILVPRYVPGRVIHLLGATQTSITNVDGVVWNLAMAPGGRFSAATTQTALYVFRDGELTAEIRLPVTYANSLAISDRGEALVGSQGAEGEGRAFLYHWQGNLLWEDAAATDRDAYRPAVRFAPGGDRFLLIEQRGLTAYDILRSPEP
ncbi:MAG TPA: calcium-binding protein, partial [Thermoanaerobaculia bacterium]